MSVEKFETIQKGGEKIKIIKFLKKKASHLLIIHYSSSDIGNAPVKICCISILDCNSEQTITFSLREFSSETEMLKGFLNFVKQNQDKFYLGWNLKDSTYGIPVIQKRINQLIGNEKIPINNSDIYDLDTILEKKFGFNYVSHPKLYNIAKLNNSTLINFIDGSEECKLFENSEYRKIEQSTNRKVRIILKLLTSLFANDLKVENQSISSKFRDLISSPYFQLLIAIIGILLTIFGIIISTR
jgi:hypothetical protein